MSLYLRTPWIKQAVQSSGNPPKNPVAQIIGVEDAPADSQGTATLPHVMARLSDKVVWVYALITQPALAAFVEDSDFEQPFRAMRGGLINLTRYTVTARGSLMVHAFRFAGLDGCEVMGTPVYLYATRPPDDVPRVSTEAASGSGSEPDFDGSHFLTEDAFDDSVALVSNAAGLLAELDCSVSLESELAVQDDDRSAEQGDSEDRPLNTDYISGLISPAERAALHLEELSVSDFADGSQSLSQLSRASDVDIFASPLSKPHIGRSTAASALRTGPTSPSLLLSSSSASKSSASPVGTVTSLQSGQYDQPPLSQSPVGVTSVSPRKRTSWIRTTTPRRITGQTRAGKASSATSQRSPLQQRQGTTTGDDFGCGGTMAEPSAPSPLRSGSIRHCAIDSPLTPASGLTLKNSHSPSSSGSQLSGSIRFDCSNDSGASQGSTRTHHRKKSEKHRSGSGRKLEAGTPATQYRGRPLPELNRLCREFFLECTTPRSPFPDVDMTEVGKDIWA